MINGKNEAWIKYAVGVQFPRSAPLSITALKGDASSRRLWRAEISTASESESSGVVPTSAIAVQWGPGDLPLQAAEWERVFRVQARRAGYRPSRTAGRIGGSGAHPVYGASLGARLALLAEQVAALHGLLERGCDLIDVAGGQTPLDALRVERWRTKEIAGAYMRPLLHMYFIWDPVVHHRISGKPLKPRGEIFSLSARKSIERTRREHQELLSEFESLLRGAETALEAAELGARRMNDEELFVEAKRALNPLYPDRHPYRRGEEQLLYSSAREQIAGGHVPDIVPEDRKEERRALLESLAKGETITGVETRRRRQAHVNFDTVLAAAPSAPSSSCLPT